MKLLPWWGKREEFKRAFAEWVQDECDKYTMEIMHKVMAAQPENDVVLQIKEGSTVELIIPYWEAEA